MMACTTPGIQKKAVRKTFSKAESRRPVKSTERGGKMMAMR
jgi:hypothetical protein